MKHLVSILVLCAVQGCAPASGPDGMAEAARKTLPVCAPAQLLGPVPERAESGELRLFDLPTIDYPHGTRKDMWGLSVTLRVDEKGIPVCHALSQMFGDEVVLDEQRRELVGQLAGWRYTPLVRDGRPVPMVVTEALREQEMPSVHVPLPDVPLSQVKITLSRTGCFGMCPAYLVEVLGDGSVLYRGGAFVDVEGEHRYEVPVAEVARLVESLRDKDLWSMRTSYRAPITDNPTYGLSIDMGGQVHRIEDYVGGMVGMPVAISEFEDEIDEVARSHGWITLSGDAVDRLQQEGFAFDSKAGASLLARAVANDDGHDDAAMVRLVQLGAPIPGAELEGRMWSGPPLPLIESALLHRRVALIDPLVAAGALKTGGRNDQDKIDAAFRAAIEGGSLAAVQAIWDVAGDRPHPSLTFMDEVEAADGQRAGKRVPVTLLLSGAYKPKHEWQGLEIVRWLAARGCDLSESRANGETLLHIAADTDDVALVRYLLEQGLDASTPGEYGLPPLGSARNEDIALLLLEAGTDLRMLDGAGRRFADYARDNHWGRVVAWLQRNEAEGSGAPPAAVEGK